jgi:hypothetical protein
VPAGPPDGDGEVGVLGQGVVAQPADLDQRAAAEGPDRAGHRRHAVQRVVDAPVDREPDHVLQVLRAGDQPAPVDDLGVARDGTHPPVGEGLDEPADGAGLEDGVPVHHHDQLVAGVGDAGVQRGGLAGVGWRMTRTRGSRTAAAMSAVPSVDPSSTTTISIRWSLASSEPRVSAMHSRSL